MYILRCLMLFFLSTVAFCGSQKVLISFSMPKPLLKATLNNAHGLNIPVVIKGLYQDSLEKTLKILMEEDSSDLQIDPTLFERYAIHQVPALIWEEKNCADVMYGNLNLEGMIEIMKTHGGCHHG